MRFLNQSHDWTHLSKYLTTKFAMKVTLVSAPLSKCDTYCSLLYWNYPYVLLSLIQPILSSIPKLHLELIDGNLVFEGYECLLLLSQSIHSFLTFFFNTSDDLYLIIVSAETMGWKYVTPNDPDLKIFSDVRFGENPVSNFKGIWLLSWCKY